tara:strand:- start:985 stop:1824 length:840 start_codon:yes stop_codon:yes gene_type:complete
VELEVLCIADGIPIGKHLAKSFPSPPATYRAANIARWSVLSGDRVCPRVETLAIGLDSLLVKVEIPPYWALLVLGCSVVKEVLAAELVTILANSSRIGLSELFTILHIVDATVKRDHKFHVRPYLVDSDIPLLTFRCKESGPEGLLIRTGSSLIFVDNAKDMSIPYRIIDGHLLGNDRNCTVVSIPLMMRDLNSTGILLVDSGAIDHDDPPFMRFTNVTEYGIDAIGLGGFLSAGSFTSAGRPSEGYDSAGAIGEDGGIPDLGGGDNGKVSFNHGISIG